MASVEDTESVYTPNAESRVPNRPGVFSDLSGEAAVIFVTGALESKRHHFSCARALGLTVIVIDSPASAGPNLLKEDLIDYFVPLELSTHSEKAIKQCLEAIRSLTVAVAGVVTFMDMAVLVTSRVAEELGLPGIPALSAAIARDKRMFRRACNDAGIDGVVVCSVNSEEDLEKAAGLVGFPAVLKPITGADSLGVKRVDSLEGLRLAFSEAKNVMNSLVINSGFLTVKESDASLTTNVLPTQFLLEEYLEGPEVDIDLLMYEGECFYSAVSDNGITAEPYFTETYGVLPSELPESDQAALVRVSKEAVLALHLKTGVFHIEAKMTPRGPRLIELNCRLGGGPICEMHRRVSNVDLASEQIRLCVGMTPSFEPRTHFSPRCAFAYMTTNAVASGTVGSNMSFLSKYEAQVEKLMCRVQPGDYVVGPGEDAQPSWLVELWMQSGDARCSGRLVSRICELSDQIAQNFVSQYNVM